ncbi:MAG: NAD(P)-dependent oxidoreductase [Gammaproteobacteria bacterium]|nr:NAD(P)-dependent oxidoreductase [Gammaproteobacteria bacterium]
MTQLQHQVGFIGLGAMGAPMAAHLACGGLLHRVYNRSLDKAQAFTAEHGVAIADELAALATDCNVIITCVSADHDMAGIIDALLPGLQAGTIIIDHSSIAPDTARRLAAQVSAHGGSLLDAPVSGGVEGAHKGTLSIMVGGDGESLQQVQPILQAYAARISHMGESGNGQATKAVNQVLVAGIAEAVCEGLALAEHLQLPQQALLEVLRNGAAGCWFLDQRGATLLKDDCDRGFKLSLLIKDLGILQQLAQTEGLRLAGIERAMADYSQCLQAGDGDQDISALIRLKRRQLHDGAAT